MQLKRGPRRKRPKPEADGGPLPASINRGFGRKQNGGPFMSLLATTLFSRRSLICSAFFVCLLPTALLAADKPKEIRLDWATYNPVSIVLKERGLLEKEFAKDGIAIRWVQTLGSNKALEFLNAGSIDFGSTAGSAALLAKINGNPIKSIYVYSRPEWTALVTKDPSIK